MKTNSSSIITIGILVLVAVLVREPAFAILSAHYRELGINGLAAFAVSTAAVGIITFFGFVWLGFKTGGPLALHKEGMRLAIVAAVVVVDLVLVTTTAFFNESAGSKLPQVTESFLNQFNTIVGVVVAFYFGASAYVQVRNKEAKGDKDQEDKP